MRVTILNTYSWYNKGDAAIVLGTVHALRHQASVVDVTVVSMTPEIDRAPFAREKIGVVGGPFAYIYATNRPLLWRGLAFLVTSLLSVAGVAAVRLGGSRPLPWLPKRAREFVEAIASADLVVSVGGGFWSDNARRALFVHLMQVICAQIVGRPVVCLGVSLGPFRSAWREQLTGWVLNHTATVVLREQESRPVAQAMGISARKVYAGGDMAFGLAQATGGSHQQTGEGSSQLRIGVTARHWIFPNSADPAAAQAHYERTMAQTLDQLCARTRAEIVFLPQVIGPARDDDRIVQRRIRNLMGDPARVTLLEDDFAPAQLMGILAGLDIVLATRFHSAIFTMLANTPVVAIAYEHKTTGIMAAMQLDHWVIPIEAVTAPAITELCLELLAQRARVRQHLSVAVAAMAQRADASAAHALRAAFPALRKRNVTSSQQPAGNRAMEADVMAGSPEHPSFNGFANDSGSTG